MTPALTKLRNLAVAYLFLVFFASPALAQAPNGFHYVRTDQNLAAALYDVFHQQFFVAISNNNEVDVVSASNPASISKINIDSPYGLDLSPDGSRLYVTSNNSIFGAPSAEGFFVVDTVSLKVVDFVQPVVPVNPFQIFFPNTYTVPRFIAAMSNGKIFYNADQTGVTSSAIFAYDPMTGISTPRPPTGGGNFYDGIIQKSANGQRFVVLSDDSAGGDLWTYDSGSDAYIAHLRINNKVVNDAIFSPDGTRVLVAGHLLFDQNLNPIADLNPTAGFSNYRGSTFSPDGTKIYVGNSYDFTQTTANGTISYSNPVVAVYQTATAALLGYIPAPQFFTSPFNRGIAVNEQSVSLLLNDRGFAEMNLSQPNANLTAAASQTLSYPNVVIPPVGSPNSPSPAVLNGAGFRAGANVYFGVKPAASVSVSSANTINVQPPPGSPGSVDVSVSFPDGWAIYGPEAYSYGPTVLYQDVNSGDVNGGTTVRLVGYGFDTSSGQPQVTVGGSTASVTNVNLFAGVSPFTFPIEYLTFTTAPGVAGSADITVTTTFGSTTIKNGFRYIGHSLVSGVFPAQMVLDEPRGRLYVADLGTGDVKTVDVNTLAMSTLITSSGNPATGLTMTPDASKLLVISEKAGTLTIFDLNAGSILKTFYPVPGNLPTTLIPNSLVATSRGTALVGFDDPSLFDAGDLFEVDLTTGNASTVDVGCGPIPGHMLLARTVDGNTVYLSNDNSNGSSGGCLSAWSAAADALIEQKNYENGVSQLATTSLGERVLVDSSTYTPSFTRVTTVAPLDILVSQRNLVAGEKIHSTGSLQYLPTTKGIEIYDVHHGHMIRSIRIPGGMAPTLDCLVIDRTGSSLYVAEASGIGVIHLAVPPLSIGSIQPSHGNASGGSTVTIFGSGFSNGASVSLGGISAPAQVIDSTKLTFVAPAASAAKLSVTVTNPNGDSYTLDAAYDATVSSPAPIPVLTALSPATMQTRNRGNLTITGSGFVAASQVVLNGLPVQTIYLSPQQIVAYLYSIPGPGALPVTVVNPAPGGTSNVLNLQVQDANPSISSLSPSTIPASSPALELNVLSNNAFSPDSVVLWNSSPRPTLYVNTGNLLAQISASDVSTQGTASVTVKTPSAPVPLSNAVAFTITPQVPLAAVQPLSLTFTSQVRGTKSNAQAVTLASTGQLPLVISSISLADTANFTQTNNCPASLPPGQNCVIQVTFAPAVSMSVGPMLSKLTVADNSSANPETVNLAATVADFQLQTTSTSVSVTAGQSATIPLTLTVLGDTLSDHLQFSCSGLPAGATCQFSPATIIPILGSNSVTLAITTTGKASAALSFDKPVLAAGLPCLIFLGLGLARRNRRIILIPLLCSIALGLSACGGGSGSSSISSPPPPPAPSQTPAGAYTITVIAMDGAAQRTVTVNLTVTAP